MLEFPSVTLEEPPPSVTVGELRAIVKNFATKQFLDVEKYPTHYKGEGPDTTNRQIERMTHTELRVMIAVGREFINPTPEKPLQEQMKNPNLRTVIAGADKDEILLEMKLAQLRGITSFDDEERFVGDGYERVKAYTLNLAQKSNGMLNVGDVFTQKLYQPL